MNSERWRRVETLFHDAVEMSELEREAYLKAACPDDSEVLREVRELLKSYQDPGSFMEEPIFLKGLHALGRDESEMPAENLGRYRLIKRIGVGGMGEVFLAHDSVLKRQVALKLLPKFLTDDPQRVRRFQQEAHAASKISHPNVAHIYEMGVEDDRHFTSMEYVEGRTLREVLKQGKLSMAESLEIALQVARALESAHAAGVIHRDIKPENIMIRPDGYVKVLDFGLAKLHRITDVNDTRQTHPSVVHTEPGLIIGSPQYMSPEQARGVEVDVGTDIWSLGVVLYEMLCGRPPFHGATTMDLIVALLREEVPPISASLSHAPPGVRRLLRRMLSKDRDRRCSTSTEVVTELSNLIKDAGWSQGTESTLYHAYYLAFLKHKAIEAYRASEGTAIKAPFRIFITTLVAGIFLTWVVLSFKRPAVLISYDDAERRYQAGVEAIFRDDFYTAAYELDQATKRDVHARSVLVHARLAEVWAELDYSDKANYELSLLASLVSVLTEHHNLSETDSLYVNAVRTTINRDFRRAAELYKLIVEKDATNAISWIDLGRSYERLHWWNEAAYSYRQAAVKNPSLASAFLRLGAVEVVRNQEQDANSAFQRAHELYRIANDADGSVEVLNRRAMLAFRSGRDDEGNKFQDEAAGLNRFDIYQYVKIKFALACLFHKQTELAKIFEREARASADQINRVGLLFHGPDQLLVNGLLDIATLYMKDNDLINAQQYVQEASSVARRSNLKMGKAKAMYADAQMKLHEGFPGEADSEFKQLLRLEFPNKEFSDQDIALWRNTVLDVDYDVAINEFRNKLAGEPVLILTPK
ncbi:MAG TPA: protein kinase [Pyrinomonadaceae bacterium]|nr:protein kinase [Pyrinomonadaceae bacterium]